MANLSDTPLSDEEQRLLSLANWYFNDQLDLDKQLIRYGYETLKPYLHGPEGLELGTADGQMTRFLVQDFTRLTAVDGALRLLTSIPDAPNLLKVHALFEEFEPEFRFNTIIMAHILEHVDDPVVLLQRVSRWLVPGGHIAAIVPNGHSIHRLAAVHMGLLTDPCDLNERDHALGHRRVYTPQTLRTDVEAAELTVVKTGGIFLKPLSYQQIQEQWTQEMVHAFYELGKDFPDYAAEIYVVCG